MTLDLANDLIVLWGLKLSISTVIGWLSGLVGLYANYGQMKRLNKIEDKKMRERALESLAERTYLKIERIAKETPTKADDKLLGYIRLAVSAFKSKFNEKPSSAEVAALVENAEKLATKNKLERKDK